MIHAKVAEIDAKMELFCTTPSPEMIDDVKHDHTPNWIYNGMPCPSLFPVPSFSRSNPKKKRKIRHHTQCHKLIHCAPAPNYKIINSNEVRNIGRPCHHQ